MNLHRAVRQLSQMTKETFSQLSDSELHQYAQATGVPVEDLKKLQFSGVKTPHFSRSCPHGHQSPKGQHPNAYALLKDAVAFSAHAPHPDELAKFSIEDQLRILGKHRFYDQLAEAIAHIWQTMEAWRIEHKALLGVVQEQKLPSGHTAMSLVPLNAQQVHRLSQSPDHYTFFAQLIYYTRQHWGASLMHWRQLNRQTARWPEFVPPIVIPTRAQVPFAEILWRGVNTAIKIIYSIQWLLIQLHGPFASKEAWHKTQQQNYSFAALLASSSLSTFEPMERSLVMATPAHTIDYMVKHGILKTRPAIGERTGLEMLSPEKFRLLTPTNTLDFSEAAIAQLQTMPLLGDVLIKKCPALKVNVVRYMYDWVVEVVNHYLPPQLNPVMTSETGPSVRQ
ncbi:MAG: hypothetical protein D6694_04125 [Gammaproteobacteria bacterium]|nr:MAG: hypothetical protein D6694_04125 [Gammaproteobacteria bacterium]